MALPTGIYGGDRKATPAGAAKGQQSQEMPAGTRNLQQAQRNASRRKGTPAGRMETAAAGEGRGGTVPKTACSMMMFDLAPGT